MIGLRHQRFPLRDAARIARLLDFAVVLFEQRNGFVETFLSHQHARPGEADGIGGQRLALLQTGVDAGHRCRRLSARKRLLLQRASRRMCWPRHTPRSRAFSLMIWFGVLNAQVVLGDQRVKIPGGGHALQASVRVGDLRQLVQQFVELQERAFVLGCQQAHIGGGRAGAELQRRIGRSIDDGFQQRNGGRVLARVCMAPALQVLKMIALLRATVVRPAYAVIEQAYEFARIDGFDGVRPLQHAAKLFSAGRVQRRGRQQTQMSDSAQQPVPDGVAYST